MSSEKDTEEAFITKIFTNDDHPLKLLGELLSNQVSRDIIKLLIGKEMYANEIANKLDIQFNLISHHLKKMGELGLLSVNEKRIIKKGQMHKYYKINPGILILPNHTKEEINKNGFLKKFFKDGVKFLSLGIVTVFSYIFLSTEKIIDETKDQYISGDEIIISTNFEPLNISLIILAIGLFTIYVLEKKKR